MIASHFPSTVATSSMHDCRFAGAGAAPVIDDRSAASPGVGLPSPRFGRGSPARALDRHESFQRLRVETVFHGRKRHAPGALEVDMAQAIEPQPIVMLALQFNGQHARLPVA